MAKKFLRRDTNRYSKLGKNRKKLQKWRRPTGRDNKMRLRMFGYPTRPTVGHKTELSKAGLINGKQPVLVHNEQDLKAVDVKTQNIIIASVGAKKKLELIKAAETMKAEILNIQKPKSTAQESKK